MNMNASTTTCIRSRDVNTAVLSARFLFLRCELMCSAPVLNVRFMNKQHPASLIILAPDCFFMNQLDQSGLYKPCSPH